MIKYDKLAHISTQRVDTQQNYNNQLTIIHIYFPQIKRIYNHKSIQKYAGLFSILPIKNLILYFVITHYKSFLIIKFYSFESSYDEQEIENLIEKVMNQFTKALCYNKFKRSSLPAQTEKLI